MNEYELAEFCNLFLKHKLLQQYFIVASDELARVKITKLPCVIIQNTSTRNGRERKHWIVHIVFRLNRKTLVQTFDSVGGKHIFTPKIKKFTHKNVNKYNIQANTPSNICGLYVVWFAFIKLIHLKKRYDFSKLCKRETNDLFVTTFYRKIILFQSKKDFVKRIYASAFQMFASQCHQCS